MDAPAIGSAWRELDDAHAEVQRIRSRLLEVERRLARLEVRLELEGAETPPARPPTYVRRRREAREMRRPKRAKIPYSPGPRTLDTPE